jgi:hypothetical protein
MFYRFAADAVVIFHFCFVGFVITGGVLVLRWRKLMLLHIPAVLWGITVELSGWLCPLTPLENNLRRWGGYDGYEGSFVDHYIMPILYPEGLTRNIQIVLGCFIFAVNAACYGYILVRRHRTGRKPHAAIADDSTSGAAAFASSADD